MNISAENQATRQISTHEKGQTGTASDTKPNVLNYVTTNRFYVEIGNDIKAAFSECSGLDVQIDKDVYHEGGVNHQQRIFLKQAKFGDITLKRGITEDSEFWRWVEQSLMAGQQRRRNINILVFNQAGETMQAWFLLGAVPIGWKTPSLKADSNSVAIEELVLAYEGLKVKHKKRSGGAQHKDIQRSKDGFFVGSET
ncbi:phage tail protein [filamentous cyanobacterium LEGE 11480]|uniref:Phage tail protein n=1 Tax=Romeriopsis navalis LEGE 11480 TaxID=2777977 RepID=A0A928VNC6_9CYAN|nr:phage tail protein [Romeriopsis navalis]MBE9031485.1 phage tail protein [Romeriopsis navalis LEGE 11480]